MQMSAAGEEGDRLAERPVGRGLDSNQGHPATAIRAHVHRHVFITATQQLPGTSPTSGTAAGLSQHVHQCKGDKLETAVQQVRRIPAHRVRIYQVTLFTLSSRYKQ